MIRQVYRISLTRRTNDADDDAGDNANDDADTVDEDLSDDVIKINL